MEFIDQFAIVYKIFLWSLGVGLSIRAAWKNFRWKEWNWTMVWVVSTLAFLQLGGE